MLPAGFSFLEHIGLEVQKQLYDVDVDMQFDVVRLQDYDSRLREGSFEAALMDMISGPTFGATLRILGLPDNIKGLHFFGYENPEAARLFEVLRTSTNEAPIRSSAARLQRVLLDDPPALFLAWSSAPERFGRFRLAEAGSDPLYTIWRWTENTDRQSVSAQ